MRFSFATWVASMYGSRLWTGWRRKSIYFEIWQKTSSRRRPRSRLYATTRTSTRLAGSTILLERSSGSWRSSTPSRYRRSLTNAPLTASSAAPTAMVVARVTPMATVSVPVTATAVAAMAASVVRMPRRSCPSKIQPHMRTKQSPSFARVAGIYCFI